jgi:hypothetical protein
MYYTLQDVDAFFSSLTSCEQSRATDYIRRFGEARCFVLGQDPKSRPVVSPADEATLGTIIKSTKLLLCKVNDSWRWWSGYEVLLTQGFPVIKEASSVISLLVLPGGPHHINPMFHHTEQIVL